MTFKRSPKLFVIGVALAAMTALSACAQVDGAPKQTVGTVLGGIGGAVVGSQFGRGTGQLAATAAGTLLGAYIGSEIGQSLDRADQQAMAAAQQNAHAAPVGQTIAWNNPDSGHYGSVTPVRDGYSQAGAYCREYRSEVVIDGRRETAVGTACQQPDGTWRVVN